MPEATRLNGSLAMNGRERTAPARGSQEIVWGWSASLTERTLSDVIRAVLRQACKANRVILNESRVRAQSD